MRRTFVAVFAATMLIGFAGCQKDSHDTDHSSGDPKMMKADVCSHCPGNQVATAEGKCPGCGMKVSPKMMMTDACSHCPGEQMATADGKCPGCGMKVSPKMMMTDACSHCPGEQVATADGKCPGCGMKVK